LLACGFKLVHRCYNAQRFFHARHLRIFGVVVASSAWRSRNDDIQTTPSPGAKDAIGFDFTDTAFARIGTK
jgi:hypothetical protein